MTSRLTRTTEPDHHARRVAVLYQSLPPPAFGGLRKPPKPGGYADSGADIAYVLRQAGIDMVLPVQAADVGAELDWVFPDTAAGIAAARTAGAEVLWANTVLFRGHPIERVLQQAWIVGQVPAAVERFDDKYGTNVQLRDSGCPVAASVLLAALPRDGAIDIAAVSTGLLAAHGLRFPLVVKPVRGRGSEGVSMVGDCDALRQTCRTLFERRLLGDTLMVEEFLDGEELTITVMPPGSYRIDGCMRQLDRHWPLPPVRRFNHQQGIAPYNGVVAVIHNSRVLEPARREEPAIRALLHACVRAAGQVDAAAPVRIDCRSSAAGAYKLFDLNMKPNMTGPGRPGREQQDSLSGLAARAIGWSYADLLLNMLTQAWQATPAGAMDQVQAGSSLPSG
jgi:hypothetical protein